jgi:hypothetical protein
MKYHDFESFLFIIFEAIKYIIEMESTLQLLPKRPCPLKANAFPTKVKLMTNHYYFSLKKSTDLYQFSIDT